MWRNFEDGMLHAGIGVTAKRCCTPQPCDRVSDAQWWKQPLLAAEQSR